jgi:polysaccharide pyruvyl transferase WcaK-like protein
LKYNWKAAEREERIKERVNEAIRMLNEQYQSQYVSTDWESNAFSDNN